MSGKQSDAGEPGRRPRTGARPTMRDVAVAAGVSLKTVSRVLNAEPGVVEATANRVRAEAARLQFTRNDIAAGLRRRGQVTGSIGLVIEDVANPFYSSLTRAVEEVARAHGYLLLAGSSAEDPDQERQLVQAFCARRVEGLVIVPAGGDHSYLATEIALGTGVVFVDRPPDNLAADAVVSANADGARDGVEHLIAQGHRRVAYIGDAAEISTAVERLRGYKEALERHRIPIDDDLVRLGSHDADAAEVAVRDLLAGDDPPTAVFTGNNLLTVGAYRAMRKAGRSFALVGFDDFELADMLDPPTTVVAQDAAALGRTAADLLFARFAEPAGPIRTVVLPTKLVVRGSGEVSAPRRRKPQG